MELTTTFRAAWAAQACIRSYRTMAKALGGVTKYGRDRPFSLLRVLEVLGMDDALWALRCAAPRNLAKQASRLLACDFTEEVLLIFEAERPDDPRPRKAIETSRRFAFGLASEEELTTAQVAAWEASKYDLRVDMWTEPGCAARAASARISAWAAAARVAAQPVAQTTTETAQETRLRFALGHLEEFIAEHKALISK